MDKWVFERLFKRARENGALFFGDLAHDVLDVFKEVFYRFPRECWYLVKTLCAYTPILWKSRDWDWNFILILLQFKLKRTRICITGNNIIADAAKVGKQIKIAEDLIDQILENDFCKNEWKSHDERWGELHSTTIPIPGSMSSLWKSLRLNVKTIKDEELERKEFRKIMNLESKRMLAADKKLFTHLQKHYRSFWD